jgi:hypothetical protein
MIRDLQWEKGMGLAQMAGDVHDEMQRKSHDKPPLFCLIPISLE